MTFSVCWGGMLENYSMNAVYSSLCCGFAQCGAAVGCVPWAVVRLYVRDFTVGRANVHAHSNIARANRLIEGLCHGEFSILGA